MILQVSHEEIRPGTGAGLHALVSDSFRGRLTAGSPWKLPPDKPIHLSPLCCMGCYLVTPTRLLFSGAYLPLVQVLLHSPVPQASVLTAKDSEDMLSFTFSLHTTRFQALHATTRVCRALYVKTWSLLWMSYSKPASEGGGSD